MKGLGRLARGLGGRREWGMLHATGNKVLTYDARTPAAGIAAAASGGGGSGGGGSHEADVKQASPRLAPSTRLDKLRERFRARARCNDAFGAEQCLKQYIQEGGEPQHWMLPMLLNTYGKLRQADKAWAIYQQLLKQQKQQPGGTAEHAQQEPQPTGSAVQASAAAPVAVPQDGSEPAGDSSVAANVSKAAGDSGGAVNGGAEGGPAWQARLAQRQARLAAEAERLVEELELGAFPLNDYAYSTIITALSRAEHPPYDLPRRYAAMAAEAFREMRQRGLEPNVVVWHSLMACQAKAALPDEAFATYRAMLAAGVRPTPHTFSMLVSACGRARQPRRAADVVERLMPQAGIAPQLPVWNALLGAYGRAGSVDAAYEAWVRMLDSGATPDDLTERALALAFASHPALAADVVAEARQIRQSRQGSAAAEAEAQKNGTGEGDGEEGGVGSDEDAAAAAAAAAGRPREMRAPYRLQRHRQASLPIDELATGQRSHTPLAQLLQVVQGSGSGSSSGSGGAAEAEQRGLQARQLLLLDLHGSSLAAARMVLLRRLETLVLQVAELEAEVGRMQAEWLLQHERQSESHAQEQQQQQAGRHPLQQQQQQQQQQQDVQQDSPAAFNSEGSGSTQPGGSNGGSGSAGRRRRRGSERSSQEACEQAAAGQAAAEVLHVAERWQAVGRAWGKPAGPAEGSAQSGPGPASGSGPEAPGDEQSSRLSVGPSAGQACFLPPSLCIITGMGRRSRGSGVLKGAVLELLQQQGLPTVEDPSNEGVVYVPWEPLVAYLQLQRQAMHTDHFLSAARARYLYVAAGAAGIVAAANLLPRLAPWMA
ncbi:hypothetical protein ABPG77_009980 [Micractinium sp. CCAP 211/92]